MSKPRLVTVHLDRLRPGSDRRERLASARPGMTWSDIRALGLPASVIRYLEARETVIFDPPLPGYMRPGGPLRSTEPRPRPKLVPYAGKDDGAYYPDATSEPATQPRKCLKCLAMFPSYGPGNRVCPACTPLVNRLATDASPFDPGDSDDPFDLS